jgi:uncharacterized membrane protein
MDGCLALIVFAVSVVLLIAPLISLGVSLQMRSRIRALETELRTLRARFDARDRREKREQEGVSFETELAQPPAPAEPSQPEELVVEHPLGGAAQPVETAPALGTSAPFEARLAEEEHTPLPEHRPSFEIEEEPVDAKADDEPEVEELAGEVGPTVEEEPVVEQAAARDAEPPQAAPPPPPPSPPMPKAAFDWEGLVGVKLFSWIAAVALALAAVFFLKYSIDHGWLSPTIRLLSGIVAGVGLIVLCEAKFASGYRVTANALDAAGVAILYATLFAAHDLWKLISQPVAFAFMVLVTALAVFLATRRSSVFIALLGLLGGFATPALLATGQDRPFSLFGYLLILNAGVAWVAWKKGWPILSVLSLAFTTIYQWVWVVKFLDGPRVPVAIGVFLIFPIASVMTIWIAKARDPERSSRVFEWTAQAGAVLPMLFAFYGAAVPAFGERQSLLFFFLLIVDAGLAFLALSKRMTGVLHLLGGVATVLVFAVWFGLSWSPNAWPSILWWICGFAALYALVPELARLREISLDGESLAARYAAPALLFAFPVLAGIEDRTADPALLFGALLALVALLGALAIRQDAPWLYVPGALFAVVAEGVWSGEHLTSGLLVHGLVIYGLFAALFAGLPMIATRFGRRLATSRGVALPLLGSLVVLLPFTDSDFASDALVGIVVLVAGVVVGLQALGGQSGRRFGIVSGAILGWLLLICLWIGVDLKTTLVSAVAAVAVLALVITAGSAWWAATRARPSGDPSIYLGLVVYGFILLVAGRDDLAGNAGPILTLLAFVTVLFAVGSILARTPEAHLVSAALTQVSLIVWCSTVGSWRLTLVAVLASVITAFFSFAVWRVAGRVGARGMPVHAAAVIASVLTGHFVAIVASVGDWTLDWPVLLMAHLALVLITFTTAWKTGWHGVAIASVLPTAIGYLWWGDSMTGYLGAPVKLAFATLLYLPYIAYPLALGARAGKAVRPYLAALAASVPYFFFAKETLERIDFELIAILPLAQAGLMAALLVRLLKIEPEGERTSGRLALVAGALLAFVTVAIPLQLDKEWITIGWALEAAALVWLFRRIPHNGLLATGAALFAIVFVRLVFNPAVFDYHPRSSIPIFNWYLYTYLVPAAAMYAVPYLLDAASDWARHFRAACNAGGTILLFLLLNIEIADFYSKGATLTFDLDAGLAQDLTYTIGWALFAIAMLVAGLVKGSRGVRIASLALLVVAMAKCFLHDLMRLGGLYRVGSLVGLAVSLAIVALLLQRFVFRDKTTE